MVYHYSYIKILQIQGSRGRLYTIFFPHVQTIEMATGHVRIQSVLILICQLDVAIDLSLSVAVLEIAWEGKRI